MPISKEKKGHGAANQFFLRFGKRSQKQKKKEKGHRATNLILSAILLGVDKKTSELNVVLRL